VKKILIVDDSPSMRMVLRYILEKEQNQTQKPKGKAKANPQPKQKQKQPQIEENYIFFEAGSGEEALMQFKKESPDLVLLDIIMPGGDEVGLTVLKKIRAINSKAAVIMISAIGQGPTIAECTKLGAIDYIVKPFDDLEVLKVVGRSLT
jgi:two-component system, chemotaxis family, chemotaxis protein CheY